MPHDAEKPRILFVTPEVSHLPPAMNSMSNSLKARAGVRGDLKVPYSSWFEDVSFFFAFSS